jgi:predicted SAM-dependent methyltransferase
MGSAKSTMTQQVVSRLLTRLPSGLRDRLIRLIVRLSRRVFDLFPHWKEAVLGGRDALAADYLKGAGIEIGALHSPVTPPEGTRVVYVDKYSTDFLRSQYPELSWHKLVEVEIRDDGESLTKFRDESQDFVIANHFIEHCQDPIGTIGNMVRVLREDGILYITLPDKRYTFDCDRPITPLEHILSDYRDGPGGSRRQHLEEWCRMVRKIEDSDALERAIQQIITSEGHIHYHVWTQTEMLELIITLQRLFDLEVELVRKYVGEVILILRKRKTAAKD